MSHDAGENGPPHQKRCRLCGAVIDGSVDAQRSHRETCKRGSPLEEKTAVTEAPSRLRTNRIDSKTDRPLDAATRADNKLKRLVRRIVPPTTVPSPAPWPNCTHCGKAIPPNLVAQHLASGCIMRIVGAKLDELRCIVLGTSETKAAASDYAPHPTLRGLPRQRAAVEQAAMLIACITAATGGPTGAGVSYESLAHIRADWNAIETETVAFLQSHESESPARRAHLPTLSKMVRSVRPPAEQSTTALQSRPAAPIKRGDLSPRRLQDMDAAAVALARLVCQGVLTVEEAAKARLVPDANGGQPLALSPSAEVRRRRYRQAIRPDLR